MYLTNKISFSCKKILTFLNFIQTVRRKNVYSMYNTVVLQLFSDLTGSNVQKRCNDTTNGNIQWTLRLPWLRHWTNTTTFAMMFHYGYNFFSIFFFLKKKVNLVSSKLISTLLYSSTLKPEIIHSHNLDKKNKRLEQCRETETPKQTWQANLATHPKLMFSFMIFNEYSRAPHKH